MANRRSKNKFRAVRDYILIALSMIVGSLGWCAFLLPHHITIGGVAGISSVVLWGFGIPVQYTYFAINILLLSAALIVLGWNFCVRTIYAVIIFTISTSLVQSGMSGHVLFADEPFLACIVGGVLMGLGMGVALQCGSSSGGSDVIAAMVHKYHDYSLGHVILACDLCVITSSYLVLGSWEKVIYGYIVLFVMSFCVDYVANGARSSVQFFIVSQKWEEIGQAINNDVDRGCTVIDAHGFYTGQPVGMLFVIARRTESRGIFQVVADIDPQAFVSQSAVSGVYGMGFDRLRIKKGASRSLPNGNKKTKGKG